MEILGSSSTAFFIADAYQPAGSTQHIQLEFEPHHTHHDIHSHHQHPAVSNQRQGRKGRGSNGQASSARKPRQTKAQKMVIQQQSSNAPNIVVSTNQISENSPPTSIEASSGQQHIDQSSSESHIVRAPSSSNVPMKIDLVEQSPPE